ncbi:MAG: hypothetical protein Q8N63_03735 [Nanoarchaeota archaeon]|nr:hypothetical protein [Nanoarchaeota archaeon]
MKNKRDIKNTKKSIAVEFEDGSVFSIDDPNWVFALESKLNDENISFEEFKQIFIKEVIKHWKNRTIPTKWPWDCSWEEDFKDDIWHRLYHELYDWEEREVKKTFGYKVAGLTSARWFLDEVNRENAKLIKEGVAIKNNELIIRKDTEEAKIYDEISERYGKLVHDETQKEFEKRKEEAKNRFKNQAELAKEVLYYSIRGRLMGVILSKATKGKSGSIVTSDNSISIVKHDSVLTKKFDSEDNEDTKVRFIKKIKKKKNKPRKRSIK